MSQNLLKTWFKCHQVTRSAWFLRGVGMWSVLLVSIQSCSTFKDVYSIHNHEQWTHTDTQQTFFFSTFCHWKLLLWVGYYDFIILLLSSKLSDIEISWKLDMYCKVDTTFSSREMMIFFIHVMRIRSTVRTVVARLRKKNHAAASA